MASYDTLSAVEETMKTRNIEEAKSSRAVFHNAVGMSPTSEPVKVTRSTEETSPAASFNVMVRVSRVKDPKKVTAKRLELLCAGQNKTTYSRSCVRQKKLYVPLLLQHHLHRSHQPSQMHHRLCTPHTSWAVQAQKTGPR